MIPISRLYGLRCIYCDTRNLGILQWECGCWDSYCYGCGEADEVFCKYEEPDEMGEFPRVLAGQLFLDTVA